MPPLGEAIRRWPYQSSATIATPPRNSMIGGSTETRARDLQVRAVQAVRTRRANRSASCALRAERLHDAMAGEGLGGQVRQMLEMLLAAPGRSAHALPQPDERIDDERRAGHRHQRQLPVELEHRDDPADRGSPSRIRSPTVSETACWTWLTSFVMRDISWPVVRRLKKAAD